MGWTLLDKMWLCINMFIWFLCWSVQVHVNHFIVTLLLMLSWIMLSVTPLALTLFSLRMQYGNITLGLMPGGTKSLPEPMLTNNWWGLHKKCSRYLWLIWVIIINSKSQPHLPGDSKLNWYLVFHKSLSSLSTQGWLLEMQGMCHLVVDVFLLMMFLPPHYH